MKEANSFTSISQALQSDVLGLAFEFLPCSALKNMALVNKLWHTVAEDTLPRVVVYAQLAKWKAMVGLTLYREMASIHTKPTDLLQAFKDLYSQITKEINQYSSDIIDYLTGAMAEKPNYNSLLVTLIINEYPETALRLVPKFNDSPLNHQLTDELKRQVTIAAVRQNGLVLEHALDKFKSDEELVLTAVDQNGFAFRYAADEFKKDRTFVLAAVKRDGHSFRYSSNDFKNDRAFVLAAVKQNGMALWYASDELKNDKEVVLAAVAQDGLAFYCASDRLKNDKDTVLAVLVMQNNAVFPCLAKKIARRYNYTLEYALAIIQSKESLTKIKIMTFEAISVTLQKDPEVLIAVGLGSLLDYTRVYSMMAVNKARILSSQCLDFIAVSNPEAYQASQYGLLLGLSIGFVAGIVSSLLIAGAVVSTFWCIGLLASSMLLGAVTGAAIGMLIDRGLPKQILDMTQRQKSFLSLIQVSRASKTIELEKQANSPTHIYYKPFFLRYLNSAQVMPINSIDTIKSIANYTESEYNIAKQITVNIL